jgi:ABC-type branched-subunit amino acid transport system ATPase component
VTLLHARDLTVSYGAVVAVDGVDLSIYAGETTALIGPNGAGKSSLLDGLAGIVPAGGRAVVDGALLTGSPSRRVALGLARTHQTPALMGPDARSEVALAACRRRGVAGGLLTGPRRGEQERAEELLDRVGLDAAAWRTPSAELGVSEQRRVEVARALATDPRVLMLDEPAAGLPTEERAAFAAMVASIPCEGRGVLLVEHDMRFVASVAHAVVVLDRGRVIATGTFAEVAADPTVRHAYLGEVA